MTRDKAEIQLSEIVFFKHLSLNVLEAIRQIATLCRLKTGEILISQGSSSQAFFIVQEGAMRLVRYMPDGKAFNLKMYGKGDMFGLLSISGEFYHHASVEAVNETDVIAIPASDARVLMATYPEFAITLVDWLVGHVHETHERIRSLAVERTERRLARALLHFHAKFGVIENGRNVITVELSQKDIAEFTATTFESVNRILRSWKKADYVDYNRTAIVILDPEKLQRIAYEGEADDIYLDRR